MQTVSERTTASSVHHMELRTSKLGHLPNLLANHVEPLRLQILIGRETVVDLSVEDERERV